MSSTPTPPTETVLRAGTAYITSAALGVALKLGLLEHIGDAARDSRDLALAAKAGPDPVYRVLRVLETAGLVSEVAPRTFSLTAAGQLLRPGHPGSMHGLIEWLTDPLHFHLWADLRPSVETGVVTFEHVYDEPFFTWIARPENRDEAAIFNGAMTSFSEVCIPAFLAAYDFSPFHTMVDVGGGHGAILRAVLEQQPHLRGILAEMPAVLPAAEAAISAAGFASRCTAVPTDFFQAVPAGGDLYFMKHILHDWNDEKAGAILCHIRRVIPAHGRLLLGEAVIAPGPGWHPAKFIDLEMLVFVGGKERSEEDWRDLLAGSGFTLTRAIETRSPLHLIEALPA